jgi:hypothetical protein
VVLGKHFLLPAHRIVDDNVSNSSSSPEKQASVRSIGLLGIAALSATAALAVGFTTFPTSALALSSVIFAATALVLFEGALKSSKNDGDSRRGLMSANGTFSRRSSQSAQKDQQLASLRDVAVIMAIMCGVAAYLVEPPISRNAISWEPVYRQLQGDWKTLHYHRTVQQCLVMILVNTVVNSLMFYMVSLAL